MWPLIWDFHGSQGYTTEGNGTPSLNPLVRNTVTLCSGNIPGRPTFFFLKGNGVDLWENGGVGDSGRRGGRGNCGQDVLCERK